MSTKITSPSSIKKMELKTKWKICLPQDFIKTLHNSKSSLNVRLKLYAKRTLLKYLTWNPCLKNSKICKVRNGKRVYKKVKPYKCPTCCKGFIFSNNLKRHIKLFHQIYCGLVNKESKPTINNNKSNQAHSSKHKEYNNAIEENTDLVKHMKSHWGDKPYECTTCGLRFHFKSGIRRHMSVHTKEKPFSCSMCNNTFTRSSSLYKHMRRIHQEDFTLSPSGPVNQNDTSATSTTTKPSSLILDADLAKQSILHVGELKPFECITCHKRFYEKTELRRHLRVHSGEKPYPCNHCEKTFGSSGNLYSHLRRMHYELCKDLYNFKPPPSSSYAQRSSSGK